MRNPIIPEKPGLAENRTLADFGDYKISEVLKLEVKDAEEWKEDEDLEKSIKNFYFISANKREITVQIEFENIKTISPSEFGPDTLLV